VEAEVVLTLQDLLEQVEEVLLIQVHLVELHQLTEVLEVQIQVAVQVVLFKVTLVIQEVAALV
jgi:hypothetical protein